MQDLRQSEIGVPGPSQLRRRKRHAAAVAGNELSVWLVAEMGRNILRPYGGRAKNEDGERSIAPHTGIDRANALADSQP